MDPGPTRHGSRHGIPLVAADTSDSGLSTYHICCPLVHAQVCGHASLTAITDVDMLGAIAPVFPGECPANLSVPRQDGRVKLQQRTQRVALGDERDVLRRVIQDSGSWLERVPSPAAQSVRQQVAEARMRILLRTKQRMAAVAQQSSVSDIAEGWWHVCGRPRPRVASNLPVPTTAGAAAHALPLHAPPPLHAPAWH